MVLDLIQEKLFYFLLVVFFQNLIIFEVDTSSSVHANNKTRNVLILGEDVTQG